MLIDTSYSDDSYLFILHITCNDFCLVLSSIILKISLETNIRFYRYHAHIIDIFRIYPWLGLFGVLHLSCVPLYTFPEIWKPFVGRTTKQVGIFDLFLIDRIPFLRLVSWTISCLQSPIENLSGFPVIRHIHKVFYSSHLTKTIIVSMQLHSDLWWATASGIKDFPMMLMIHLRNFWWNRSSYASGMLSIFQRIQQDVKTRAVYTFIRVLMAVPLIDHTLLSNLPNATIVTWMRKKNFSIQYTVFWYFTSKV